MTSDCLGATRAVTDGERNGDAFEIISGQGKSHVCRLKLVLGSVPAECNLDYQPIFFGRECYFSRRRS